VLCLVGKSWYLPFSFAGVCNLALKYKINDLKQFMKGQKQPLRSVELFSMGWDMISLNVIGEKVQIASFSE